MWNLGCDLKDEKRGSKHVSIVIWEILESMLSFEDGYRRNVLLDQIKDPFSPIFCFPPTASGKLINRGEDILLSGFHLSTIQIQRLPAVKPGGCA